jgi:hypothetical protein
LSNNKYKVEIIEDKTYTLQSTDNMHYDYVFNPDNLTRNDYLMTLAIHVIENGTEKKYALIGSRFGNVEKCAVLENSTLTILIDDSISQIDLKSDSIIRHKVISNYGTCFTIYKIESGYIIHGELEILKIDLSLNVKWTFSGADIFVTPDGDQAFQIINDKIILHDWNGTIYKLDMLGNLISDTYKNR